MYCITEVHTINSTIRFTREGGVVLTGSQFMDHFLTAVHEWLHPVFLHCRQVLLALVYIYLYPRVSYELVYDHRVVYQGIQYVLCIIREVVSKQQAPGGTPTTGHPPPSALQPTLVD